MNLRRLFIISVLMVLLFSGIGCVCAGLFDFMSDPSGPIDAKLQDNSAEYKVTTKMAMNDAGDGWTYVECMDWSGSLKIDLVNATDEQKKIIKENIDNKTGNFNMSFKYDSDTVKDDDEPYDYNITLEGDTLMVDYRADYRVDSDVSPTGSLSVVSGQIRLSGDTPMTIDFKK